MHSLYNVKYYKWSQSTSDYLTSRPCLEILICRQFHHVLYLSCSLCKQRKVRWLWNQEYEKDWVKEDLDCARLSELSELSLCWTSSWCHIRHRLKPSFNKTNQGLHHADLCPCWNHQDNSDIPAGSQTESQTASVKPLMWLTLSNSFVFLFKSFLPERVL